MPGLRRDPLERTNAAFQPTRWTLIDALRSPDSRTHDAAFDELVRLYWPPVYGYLRRSGRSRDDAAETTQAFFAELVVRRRLFERADESRGHLRALTLAALRRFLIDRHRGSAARATGAPGARRLAVDAERLAAEDGAHGAAPPAADESPERFFERRWEAAQLEEALRRCERHFRAAGRAAHWELFEARVIHPAVSAVDPPPLAVAGTTHGFASPADAAAAVQVVRKRLLAMLEAVQAEADNSGRAHALAGR